MQEHYYKIGRLQGINGILWQTYENFIVKLLFERLINMSYYIFVDNSNVWIEGKIASAVEKGYAGNTIEAHQKGIEDSSWRIDFGKLLKVVTKDHLKDVAKTILFGSKPPHNDGLWKAMTAAQYEVVALDRNVAGKEKAVDTGIISKIDRILYKEASAGDIFVLVMGDKDFKPALEAIREEKCTSIVAFWDNASGELISEADEFIDLTQRLSEVTY